MNGIRLAFWPPTRHLATKNLNACTAVGIVSPYAGILAHIPPLPDMMSYTPTACLDHARRFMQAITHLVVDNAASFPRPGSRSFVVEAYDGGAGGVPTHMQVIPPAFGDRLGPPNSDYATLSAPDTWNTSSEWVYVSCCCRWPQRENAGGLRQRSHTPGVNESFASHASRVARMGAGLTALR